MKGRRAKGTCRANNQTKLMTANGVSTPRHGTAGVPLTQILHIFIREQEEGGRADLGTGLDSSPISLEDDDAVSGDRGLKGEAIGEGGPFGVVVEGNVGQAVSEDGEEEGKVAAEPRDAVG